MADNEAPTTELKVARLEGAYEHLATRADVESLRGELRIEMSGLRGEINELRVRMDALAVELRGEMNALRS